MDSTLDGIINRLSLSRYGFNFLVSKLLRRNRTRRWVDGSVRVKVEIQMFGYR